MSPDQGSYLWGPSSDQQRPEEVVLLGTHMLAEELMVPKDNC